MRIVTKLKIGQILTQEGVIMKCIKQGLLIATLSFSFTSMSCTEDGKEGFLPENSLNLLSSLFLSIVGNKRKIILSIFLLILKVFFNNELELKCSDFFINKIGIIITIVIIINNII
jgi:hypothetical protein